MSVESIANKKIQKTCQNLTLNFNEISGFKNKLFGVQYSVSQFHEYIYIAKISIATSSHRRMTKVQDKILMASAARL